MTTPAYPGPDVAPRPVRPIPSWPGWLLLAPAVLLLIGQTVVPSARVLLLSLQQTNPMTAGDSEWVGAANYARIAEVFSGVAPALLGGLALSAVAVLLSVLVGVLGGRSTGPVAMLIRILLAVLLVCYAPAAMAIARLQQSGIPEGPRYVWLMISIQLPIVVAGAAVIALAVFAAGQRRSGVTAGALIIAGVLGAMAWTVQNVDLSLLLGAGTSTPAFQSWSFAFQRMEFGTAAAINTVLLILVGGCGVLATLVLLLARIRVDIADDRDRAPGGGSAVVAVVLTACVLAAMLVIHRVWVLGMLQPPDPELIGRLGMDTVARAMVNTWVPSGIGALLQVAVAVAAGAGIGLFRPIGRHSQWLLLIFAPWMFTGVGSIAIIYFTDLRRLDLLDAWLSLVPRLWVVVPAIFVFSWVFGGVRRFRERTGSYAPTVPTVVGVTGLIAVILWLVQAQALQWPLLIGVDQGQRGVAWLTMLVFQQRFDADGVLWLPLPLPMLLLLAAAVALFLILTRRVRIGSDR